MEIVYIVILFMAPGMIVKELTNYFVKERRISEPVYSYLFDVVFDSFVVGVVCVIIAKKLFKADISTLNDLPRYLQNFETIVQYIATMVTLSIIWCLVKHNVVLNLMLWVKNKILGKTQHTNHTRHTTTWDGLMAEKGIDDTWLVVSVFKDEQYVTSGMIASHSSTNAENFELKLEHKQKVEKLKQEHPELFNVFYEYYNTSTGLRIIFYDQELIEEHWQKYFPYK